ncbi:MAG: hypothetical protein WAL63_16980 [Solirubrobacteraceae bacterium]
MRATRRWGILLAAAAGLAIAGCGGAGHPRTVALGTVPLPSGTHVTRHVLSCDHGANPYCAEELVVVGNRYHTSAALLAREKQYLAQLGWSSVQGFFGDEGAAESPHHGLRLSYATAYEDLLGIDSTWIRRRRPIARALADAVFDRDAALSLMLERGSS